MRKHIRKRLLWAGAVAVVVGVVAFRQGERSPAPPALGLPFEVLEHRNDALRKLIDAGQEGPLIPFDQILVAVDQALVQDLISSAVPFERTVAQKYRIRVDRAGVEFEDGLALVWLGGRASLADWPEEEAFADITVFGALNVVEIDPASGLLRAHVEVLSLQAHRVDLLGLPAPIKDLVASLGKEKVEEFNVLASPVEIPVKVQSHVSLPEVGPEGGVHIEGVSIPIHAAVKGMKALRGKLFVSVGAGVHSEKHPAGPGGGAAPEPHAPGAQEGPR